MIDPATAKACAGRALPAAAALLLAGCFYIELGGGPDDDDLDVDAMVEEELAAGNYAEASSWLQEDGNMLFEGNPVQVQQLIDDLYAAGAYSVWFTGIEQIGELRVSASLAVELPSDPAAREEMLRLEADFWGEEPDPDVDQRYLVIYLD